MMNINKDVLAVKGSMIRTFFDIAATMDNVISLGVGEPDFATPWSVRNAAMDAIRSGKTHYTSNKGLNELRAVIAGDLEKKYQLSYDPDSEILVTAGGSEAIDLCIRAVVEKGDEVIIPKPCFVCYEPLSLMNGAIPVTVETKADNAFELKAEDIEKKITNKTKLIILSSPSNPTGAVMSKEEIEKLAGILENKDILVLSDEIYSEFLYDDTRHFSIASFKNMKEKTIVVNGFSKTYAMTGWRIGYACAPKQILASMEKIHQYALMSAPTISQYAAVCAMNECEEDVEEMRKTYDMRRRFVVQKLNEIGLDTVMPKGAFYVFPSIKSTSLSSEEFCRRLLEQERVAVVPGNAFGECGEGYVRISYCYSTAHLKKALERIGRFMSEL